MLHQHAPWELEPSLTDDRLRALASVFIEVRRELVQLHDPEKGDGRWSLGARAHERNLRRLDELARSPAGEDWLRVRTENLFCVLYVDGTRLRFFRGDEEDCSTIRRQLAALQRKAPQLSLLEDAAAASDEEGWTWMIAYSIDLDGRVDAVHVFQGLEDGRHRNAYSMRAAEIVPTLTTVVDELPPAVEQEPVSVSLRDDISAAKGSGDAGSAR